MRSIALFFILVLFCTIPTFSQQIFGGGGSAPNGGIQGNIGITGVPVGGGTAGGSISFGPGGLRGGSVSGSVPIGANGGTIGGSVSVGPSGVNGGGISVNIPF